MQESTPKSMKYKGGLARAASLSPERRSELARNAAIKRWSNRANLDNKEKPHIFRCQGVWFCKVNNQLYVLCKGSKKLIWHLANTKYFPQDNP